MHIHVTVNTHVGTFCSHHLSNSNNARPKESLAAPDRQIDIHSHRQTHRQTKLDQTTNSTMHIHVTVNTHVGLLLFRSIFKLHTAQSSYLL